MSLNRASKVQEWRRIPDRSSHLAASLGEEFATIKRQHKTFGGIAAAWNVVPEHLAQGAVFKSLSRGVLTVSVSEASLRFELDRWLREGGRDELSKAGMRVRNVKIVG
ncbi:MAG: DUF721 domain-containing protein [Planctomycetes bacterium]|nr:DUF721 domain-containing protein [Planctomycetota bacterium]